MPHFLCGPQWNKVREVEIEQGEPFYLRNA